MMATTHAFAGLLLVSPLAFLHPEQAPTLAAAALLGGIFPDFDVMVGQHRRTLHFPVLYWVPTLGSLALLAGGVVPLALPVFFGAAAIHSGSDVLGGGLSRTPWQQNSEKAVYCHVTQTWLAPRRYIPYDGAPSDFALAGVLAASAIVYQDPKLWTVVAVGLVISGLYTGFRKTLPQLERWLYKQLPILRPVLNLF